MNRWSQFKEVVGGNMKSSDRTLLQHLGFDDPDKRNEEHDLGCRYMVQPATMSKLVAMFGFKPSRRFKDKDTGANNGMYSQRERRVFSDQSCREAHEGRIEVVIQRGGGYHIGFADAEITPLWRMSAKCRTYITRNASELHAVAGPEPGYLRFCDDEAARAQNQKDRDQWLERRTCLGNELIDRGEESVSEVERGSLIGVEVKIGQVSCASVIRQIKLYDSYLPARWILATRYAITAPERQTLLNEGITHIRLGAGFDVFLEEQRNATVSESPEL